MADTVDGANQWKQQTVTVTLGHGGGDRRAGEPQTGTAPGRV